MPPNATAKFFRVFVSAEARATKARRGERECCFLIRRGKSALRFWLPLPFARQAAAGRPRARPGGRRTLPGGSPGRWAAAAQSSLGRGALCPAATAHRPRIAREMSGVAAAAAGPVAPAAARAGRAAGRTQQLGASAFMPAFPLARRNKASRTSSCRAERPPTRASADDAAVAPAPTGSKSSGKTKTSTFLSEMVPGSDGDGEQVLLLLALPNLLPPLLSPAVNHPSRAGGGAWGGGARCGLLAAPRAAALADAFPRSPESFVPAAAVLPPRRAKRFCGGGRSDPLNRLPQPPRPPAARRWRRARASPSTSTTPRTAR